MTRIIYASYRVPVPIGGVRVLADHVALLREHGWDARLWFPSPDGRTDWLNPDLPYLESDTLDLTGDDLLVVPETPMPPGADPAPGARCVIFNQNHFYTFAVGEWTGEPYPGWQQGPAAIWTVSAESADVLAALLPGTPVTVVPNPVDTTLYRAREPRLPGIAWMPRKRPQEARLLDRLLRADPRVVGTGRGTGLELHRLDGRPITEVAEVMGRASVFVALGLGEGFGLPVAEALASECLVVGYDGGGGRDLFEAPGVTRVPDQRPLLLARAAVDLAMEGDPQRLGRAARDWIIERHHSTVTARHLVRAVDEALAAPGTASTAIHPARWLHLFPGASA